MSLIATTERRDAAPRTSLSRRVWGWVSLIAAIVVIGSVFAAFQRDWTAPDPYEIDSPRYDGALAVATLLEEHGVTIETTDRFADAREMLSGDETLVITDAGILRPEDVAELAEAAAHTVIVDADYAALDTLFPGIGFGGAGTGPVSPTCDLPAAANAGAIVPGTAYDASSVTGCYPVDDGYALLRTNADDDSVVTVLDGSAVLVNDHLDVEGHAALAVGLLGQHDDLVWYTPSHDDAAADGAPAIGDFVPPWVTPTIILALFVALAAGIWRGRRFGPLVAEALPVTVRAGETLEGRARLYRAAEEPAHALDALRRGASARMAKRVGLAPDSTPDQVARAVAGVLGRDPQQVHHVLTAPSATDREFADLGERLRELEAALDTTNPWEGRSR